MIFTKNVVTLFLLTTLSIFQSAMAKDKSAMHKLVFALKITDEQTYGSYREAIAPLMKRLGIVVLREYKIADVLHSKASEDQVTRLAVFGFPDKATKQAFFTHPTYEQAKSQFFTPSTSNFVQIIE